MDRSTVDPRALESSLRFIQRINKLLGYTRATLHHLERLSKTWKRGEKISLIDLATGSADVPRAILRWADRRGWDVRIVAVDLHPITANVAALEGADSRLTVVRADVLDAPFLDGSFDYALSSMFLHHLDDDLIVRALAEMNRLARRGVIVSDLLRHRRAYAWISFFTLFASAVVRHDAKASVAQALNRQEIIALRDRAGLSFATYYKHFGHRFVLAGHKQGA
jgi:ubiquinone/menaquinone biosynthesis C-methylase UbiE